ncbi:unnamed protein product (macronuclear) [Paramecium tetraurelia]|uniref:Transmembrane protein n=1 Tax=Paramecium tetraurelia TaxID=5888 RepID=A0BX34_PARTE|nr:uncharacterized protein GSPATT00032953001 [Paramecium tetraurelia]CAK63101.1 unnamed protein product [Paramecium tetraurelia]|eukprot:XP_001430499.1 hypothetical protein (macronuclear) [Paramecium tetraurelia strain d4-2]
MKQFNQLKNFNYYVASYHILLEMNFINLNKLWLYLIHLISEFQMFGIIVLNLNEELLQLPIMNIDYGLNIISIVSRPYKLIVQDNFFLYSYTVPLTILSLYIIHQFFTYFQFSIQSQKSLMEYVLKSNNIKLIFHALNLIFIALFDKLFCIPCIQLACYSLQKNINSDSFGAVEFINTLFSMIALILVFWIQLLYMMLVKEAITLQLFNFKVLIFQGLDYFYMFLIYIFVILDCINLDTKLRNYLIFVLFIISTVLKLNQLLSKYQYACDMQDYLINLNVAFILISIILIGNDFISDKQNLIIIVVVVPSLVIAIVQQVKKKTDFNMLVLLPENQSTDTLQYLITVFSQKDQLNCIQQFSLSLFVFHHRNNCQDKSCSCKKTNLMENDIKLRQLYLKQLILDFGKSINRLADQSSKAFFSLFYIQSLIAINQSVKAYQQTNILLLKQNVHQISDQQNIFSEQTSYSVTVEENQNVYKKKSNSDMIHRLEKISLNQISYINLIKLSIILEIAKQNLISSFSFGNVVQKTQLSQSVQLFMKVEEQHQQLKQNIVNIINRKKDIFMVMSSTTKLNPERFLQQCLDLIRKINIMENELQHLFQEFPSKKMQSIYSFYCAEILSNFLQAYRIINYNAISDNALIKIQKNYQVDLLSTQLHYMILVMDHQGTGLQIVERSHQMHKIVEYEQQEFKEVKSILSLLPRGFSTIHKHLIEDFLISGRSKFFREQNVNLILQRDSFLSPVDFFFDFDLTKLQELTFQVFFSETNGTNSYLILNNKHLILGVTRELCKQLKLQEFEYERVPDMFYLTEIQQIIPEYYQLIDQNKIDKSQPFSNVQIVFNDKTPTGQKSLQTYVEQLKKNPECTRFYYANIVVTIRLTHSIIEIKTVVESKKSIQQESLDQENFEQECYEFIEELHIQQPNLFNNDLFPKLKKEPEIQIYCYIQEEIPEHIDQIDTNRVLSLQQRQLLSESIQQYDLISPGKSNRQLIDKTTSFATHQINFSQQQRFFQNQIEEKEKEQSQSNQSGAEKGFAKLNYEQNQQNAEIRENLRQQLNDENQTSIHARKLNLDNAASSTLGTFSQNFQLFKKYELLQQIVQSVKFSIIFDLMVFSLLIISLISIIFAIVLINNSSTDIYSALSQLQMLEFYTSFMNPCYLFLSSFASTYNYKNGTFDQNQTQNLQSLTQYNQYIINQSFVNIKQSYGNQSKGNLLQQDLSSTLLDFQHLKESQFTSEQISMREAIFQIIQYQYNFQTIFIQENGLEEMMQQLISYIVNLNDINDEILNLNTEIITYISDSNLLLQHKWIVLCIRCTYLILLFQISSWLLYMKHMRKYSKLLKLFQKVDVVWVLRDLERCKELLSLLNKDSNLMFRYKFNIFLKERFFKSELSKKHIIQDKIKRAGFVKLDTKQKLFMSRLGSFLFFASLFGVFFIFSFTMNMQGINFMDYYQMKSQQYNSIGELGLSIPKAYSLREVLYFKSNNFAGYQYMSQNLTDQYLNIIQSSLDIMSNYLQTYTSLESNYNDETLLQLNNETLCEDESIAKTFDLQQQYLCKQIYDNVMDRGLSITITKIRNILLTEMNNSQSFTYRINPPFNEIEIGIYLSVIIMNVLQTIKTGLSEQADQLNMTIQIVSIIYLVFTFLKIGLILLFVRGHYLNEFQNVKKLTILLPQAALFIDDLFERQLRQLIAKENLV